MVDQGAFPELFSPRGRAEPHPIYTRMRAAGRIHRLINPRLNVPVWTATRYDDCVELLRDPRFVRDFRKLPAETQERYRPLGERSPALDRHMLGSDPPDHTRLRGVVQKAFSPREMERLRPRVQAIADELLDAVIDQGRMDLVAELAVPLPVTVIADLLGVPREDRHQFRRWTKILISPTGERDFIERIQPVLREFERYLRERLARRREAPRDDLVSKLLAAEEQERTMSPTELTSMVFLLLVAGHETTVHLIASGALLLLSHPDERRRVEQDPGLIGSAVEEALRHEGPVEFSMVRWALEDVEVFGARVPAGEGVGASILSADHDPDQFPDPDRFDVGRSPNRHIAFGSGIHFCLGAMLARIEAAVTLSTLLRRLPRLALAVPKDAIEWTDVTLLRGPAAVPVEF
ncbi:cytochrome P450 [Sorangium sp. So ce1036]|uniref:cytochrome P450 family protein n=1 Tax=Sorangium sp. So ce1036 TaxID=3133328 RepID=UPI003F06B39F